MLRSLFVALALVAFAGCPKQVTTTVSGNDDEAMDKLGSQLEELKTKTDLTCKDQCDLKPKACGISKQACDIAGKKAGRDDFQKYCVSAQEACANFTEACNNCSPK